jgi:hypothetical protein
VTYLYSFGYMLLPMLSSSSSPPPPPPSSSSSLFFFFFFFFVQDIYKYIPEKIMLLGYIALQLFCSYILWNMYCYFPCMFCIFILVLSYTCVQCPVWLFSVVLLGMLFRYFLHDSEIISVAPIITGITYFTFQICHCHRRCRCCHHHHHQCIHISTN